MLLVEPNKRYVAECIVLLTSLGAKRAERCAGKSVCDLLEIKHVHRKVLDLNKDVAFGQGSEDMVEGGVRRLLEREQVKKSDDDEADLCLPQVFIDGVFAGDHTELQGLEDDGLLGRILRREICVKCYHDRPKDAKLCGHCCVTFEEVLPGKMTIEEATLDINDGAKCDVLDEDCESGSDERYKACKASMDKAPRKGLKPKAGGVLNKIKQMEKHGKFVEPQSAKTGHGSVRTDGATKTAEVDAKNAEKLATHAEEDSKKEEAERLKEEEQEKIEAEARAKKDEEERAKKKSEEAKVEKPAAAPAAAVAVEAAKEEKPAAKPAAAAPPEVVKVSSPPASPRPAKPAEPVKPAVVIDPNALTVGCTVEVLEKFMGNSSAASKVELTKGMIGEVDSLDAKGDAVIKFTKEDGSRFQQWVLKGNHGKLKKIVKAGTHWVRVKRGDPIPQGALVSGKTQQDGQLYVGRCNGEAGKINIDDGKMWNFWGNVNGPQKDAEILCCPSKFAWQPIKRGDPMPPNAVRAGETPTDGVNYVGRHNGEAGKVNTQGGCFWHFWGQQCPKMQTAEILVVDGPVDDGASKAAAGKGGLVQVTSQGYALGMRLECRDAGDEWLSGIVTCLKPLKIRPNDCSEDFEWDEVRQPEAGQQRQRCRFGADCYRKNPDHKKEYCHPGDPDFESAKMEAGAPSEAAPQGRPRKSVAPKGRPKAASDSSQAQALSSVPDSLRGYMWKRSPHPFRLRSMDWRFVIVADGKIAWFKDEAEAKNALASSSVGDGKGCINLGAGPCVVEIETGNETTFTLKPPRGGIWASGAINKDDKSKDRSYTFDTSKSPHTRTQWAAVINKMMQMSPSQQNPPSASRQSTQQSPPTNSQAAPPTASSRR